MSPVAVSLGPVTIYWYSVFILIGIVAAYFLAKPAARRLGISAETLQMSIFYGVIPGIIGARLYHVLDEWPRYSGNFAEIFALNEGGLGILGGLLGGVLGLWFYARKQRIRRLTLMDMWAPGVLLAQAIGRLGNWTNQEAFGPPTEAPWRIFIAPENRPSQYLQSSHFHPTFFYEAAWDLLGVAALLLLRTKHPLRTGTMVGAYLVIYGSGRFLVEFYRFDTAAIGSVPVAHLVSFALVGLGLYLLLRPNRRESLPD